MSQNHDSQVSIGPKPLGAVADEEADNVDEYLGYLVFSTTGEVHVPREWLMEQFHEKDVRHTNMPRKPSRWSAYRRTMQELLEDGDFREYTVYSDDFNRRMDCKLEMEKSDEMGSNVFIIYSSVFFPEELIGEEGGDWRRTRLGYFDFVSPDDGPGGLMRQSDIEKDNVHYDQWERACNRASNLFTEMQEYHNYSDLQKILDTLHERTSAVPIRRAVYFIGAHYSDSVEALSEIWEGMNQFKNGGEEMRIETTPVINLESQRELVASRAREMVEDMVDDIVTETIQEWKEEEEETAEEAAREIMDQLGDSEQISSEYNQLLSMRLSVKDILQERMDEFAGEQKDIIQRVLDQQDLEVYE